MADIDKYYNGLNNNTERRICQECIHIDRCECDSANLIPCRFYIGGFDISYNFDKENKEYRWQEMSYYRYTDGILDCRYDEEDIEYEA